MPFLVEAYEPLAHKDWLLPVLLRQVDNGYVDVVPVSGLGPEQEIESQLIVSHENTPSSLSHNSLSEKCLMGPHSFPNSLEVLVLVHQLVEVLLAERPRLAPGRM